MAGVLAPLGQVNLENLGAGLGFRQIHEEDFIKTALAQQFRRQGFDVVGGGDGEDLGLALRHPGEQGADDAPGRAAFAVGGQTLFDLVDPKHAGGHVFGGAERFPQVTFRLAVVLVVQGAEIQAQQGQCPGAGHGLGGQAFAGALDAQQQDALGRVQAGGGLVGQEHGAALGQPVLEGVESSHVR